MIYIQGLLCTVIKFHVVIKGSYGGCAAQVLCARLLLLDYSAYFNYVIQ